MSNHNTKISSCAIVEIFARYVITDTIYPLPLRRTIYCPTDYEPMDSKRPFVSIPEDQFLDYLYDDSKRNIELHRNVAPEGSLHSFVVLCKDIYLDKIPSKRRQKKTCNQCSTIL